MTRYETLPPRVHGFTVCTAEPDGDFYTIVLNDSLSYEMQQEAYLHEDRHIQYDHFHDERDLEEIEAEARAGRKKARVNENQNI